MDHTIVHFEIPADNPEALAKFYTEMLADYLAKAKALGATVVVDKTEVPRYERHIRRQPIGGHPGAPALVHTVAKASSPPPYALTCLGSPSV